MESAEVSEQRDDNQERRLTMTSKFEYLKKYQSVGSDGDGKKKRRKKSSSKSGSESVKGGTGLRIIDDEADTELTDRRKVVKTWEESEEEDEKPVVVPNELDDKRRVVSSSWVAVGGGNLGRMATEAEDASPPRRTRRRHDSSDEDASPPRRKPVDNGGSRSGKREVERSLRETDASPPRRRRQHDSSEDDASPPRRKPVDNGGGRSGKREVERSLGDADVSPPRRRRRHDSSDDEAPPPRRKPVDNGGGGNGNREVGTYLGDADASPPRRRRPHESSDDDASPSRRKPVDNGGVRSGNRKVERSLGDDDASPPRRRRRHDSSDGDASPPCSSSRHEFSRHGRDHRDGGRKRSHGGASLERRNRLDQNSATQGGRERGNRDGGRGSRDDPSPLRSTKRRSRSPPIDRSSRDVSYGGRRGDGESSAARHSSDNSPSGRSERHRQSKRQVRIEDGRRRDEASPSVRGTHEERAKTVTGYNAGLQSAKDFKVVEQELRRKHKAEMKGADAADSGHGAQTVYRDKKGRKLDMLNEFMRQQDAIAGKKVETAEAQYSWGRGKVQKEKEKEWKEELDNIAAEPFARTADDSRLEAERKAEIRPDDPMAAYVAKRESKQKVRSGIPRRPEYKGPPPKPNRFGIRPGYRWDGVDRGNDWEERIIAKSVETKYKEELAYQWASADM